MGSSRRGKSGKAPRKGGRPAKKVVRPNVGNLRRATNLFDKMNESSGRNSRSWKERMIIELLGTSDEDCPIASEERVDSAQPPLPKQPPCSPVTAVKNSIINENRIVEVVPCGILKHNNSRVKPGRTVSFSIKPSWHRRVFDDDNEDYTLPPPKGFTRATQAVNSSNKASINKHESESDVDTLLFSDSSARNGARPDSRKWVVASDGDNEVQSPSSSSTRAGPSKRNTHIIEEKFDIELIFKAHSKTRPFAVDSDSDEDTLSRGSGHHQKSSQKDPNHRGHTRGIARLKKPSHGSQHKPRVIEEESENEIEVSSIPVPKRIFPKFISQSKPKSRYCKPTVDSLQEFIGDNESNANSVGSIDSMGIELDGYNKYQAIDIDAMEVNEDIQDLEIDMKGWGRSEDEEDEHDIQEDIREEVEDFDIDMVGWGNSKDEDWKSRKGQGRKKPGVSNATKHQQRDSAHLISDLTNDIDDLELENSDSSLSRTHCNYHISPTSTDNCRELEEIDMSNRDRKWAKEKEKRARDEHVRLIFRNEFLREMARQDRYYGVFPDDELDRNRGIPLPSIEPSDRDMRCQARNQKPAIRIKRENQSRHRKGLK
ncbi:hypothetical protein K469DRAFT_795602 [Zopfia rhizophila CBS 207.26]|uniref:Uncharacterized protein n=1 Tax=Zopfia rhizophila CBS 207.26 TaxID=1314779 RepID=A0A6A6EPV4_9PEZI|nr:hypothetical protein K469DRAFT_795602 [Zopfia rhizophila CBS 207.26]